MGLFKPKKSKPVEPSTEDENVKVGYVIVELYKTPSNQLVAHVKSDYPADTGVISALSTHLEVARLKMLDVFNDIMVDYVVDKIDGDDYT